MLSSTADEFVIEISDLTIHRGTNIAINNVSASISRGSITGLLGPSGCGKTTLMRAIVGTQRITRGSVLVDNVAAGNPALRGRLGYVTQSPSIYNDLTVADNISYFAAVSGMHHSRRERSASVAHTMTTLGLESYATTLTSNLSGGQRGRVSLACAMVTNPDILVLDEPTVGLDPVLRSDLWQHFRHLADVGHTLIVSSHVMDEAEHCDDLLLMRDGSIIAHLTPDELRHRTGTHNLEDAFLTLITSASPNSPEEPQ